MATTTLCLLILLITSVLCDLCANKKITTCTECLATKNCVWCTDPNIYYRNRCFKRNSSPCNNKIDLKSEKVEDSAVYYNHSTDTKIDLKSMNVKLRISNVLLSVTNLIFK